jgi:hypothetical protein
MAQEHHLLSDCVQRPRFLSCMVGDMPWCKEQLDLQASGGHQEDEEAFACI